jgi:tRNA threonylcarbamoyladenosine biosynthesis protein TsaB
MADFVLDSAGVKPSEVDLFAVAAGPGSFTGLRIGVGTVKGMAWAVSKPCAAVSTLFAMAHLHTGWNGIVCPAMDARRNQIYIAAFDTSGGNVVRLLDDCAIGSDEMCAWISKAEKPVLLVGDGAKLLYDFAKDLNICCTLAPEQSRYQNAAGVAAAAVGHGTISAAELKPNYLRLSQAERERGAKAAGLEK